MVHSPMALSNAERQKRWRDKRNALAKQAEAGLAKSKRNDRLVEQFCANAGALVDGLITEGDKEATFSPNTVRRLAVLLKRQVDSLRNGHDLPELSPSKRRQKKKRLRLDKPLQWILAPRHSSKTRRKAGRTPSADAGVSANAGSGAYDINVT